MSPSGAENSFPVIDFSGFFGVGKQKVSEEIVHALNRAGCFYLINHGITLGEIEDVRQKSPPFFRLPAETKMVSARPSGFQPASGYVGEGVEKDTTNPGANEIRESFDILPDMPPRMKSKEAEELFVSMEKLFYSCTTLAKNLLECISLGFHLPQPFALLEAHQNIGSEYQSGSTRVSGHTDFGTMSFIFQDDTGGLEGDPNLGRYIPIPSMENATFVVAADVLPLWVGDTVKPLKHRVSVPDKYIGGKNRQSIVFFVDPDFEGLVYPLVEKTAVQPTLAKDIVMRRYKLAFESGGNY